MAGLSTDSGGLRTQHSQPNESPGLLTLESSTCWTQGRHLFQVRIEQKKIDPEVLKRFFAVSYSLDQTIDNCKGIQEQVAARYTARNAAGIGTLIKTLNSAKVIGDKFFPSAPECVSVVWFAVSTVLQVVSDDVATCQMIAGACDRIVTIVLATLLYENRYEPATTETEEKQNLAVFESRIIEKISTLCCEILDFVWHIQNHIDPIWYKKSDDVVEALAVVEAASSNQKHTRWTTAKYNELKEKAKGFGKQASEKVTENSIKLKNSMKEAFTSELKSKFAGITAIYQEINSVTSIAFQDKVLETVEKLPEDVKLELKNLEDMFERCSQKLEVKLDELQTSTDEIKTITNSTATAVTTVSIEVFDVKTILSEMKTSAEDESIISKFRRYMNCFRRYPEHENIIQSLFHKKKEDGATAEKSWFLKLGSYQDWKSESKYSPKLVCLKAKRGHGKTMTLLSVVEDLSRYITETNSPVHEAILLRFFFKLGDAGLQSTMGALETLLRQLLAKILAERDAQSLKLVNLLLERNDIQKIDAEMQSSNEEIRASLDISNPETKTPKLVCRIISQLAETFGVHLYIVLDALDECEDRVNSGLVGHLRDLAYSESSSIKVLFSTRDEANIELDFQEHDLLALSRGSTAPKVEIPYVEVVELTKENNAPELHDYLSMKLRPLVERRIGKPGTKFSSHDSSRILEAQVQEKAVDLANSIRGKVNGDFSYATMVVANLQQPSKKSLEMRIRDLPSDIGEIYRQRLDLLSAEERLLVLFALKWVAWSVSDVTPIEIVEHFREIYSTDEPGLINSPELNFVTPSPPKENVADYNPSDDPDIRELISHLRHSGRDFFSFNTDRDPVVVHLSIREWIRGGSKIPKLLENARAQVTNSLGGELVFQFSVMTDKVPRGYHELAELMSEEQSHLGIAIDALRALNHKDFQSHYMQWDPPLEYAEYWKQEGIHEKAPRTSGTESQQQAGTISKRRYEIRHWYDHVRALQAYWNTTAAETPRWLLFKNLVVKFAEQGNWRRWYVQHRQLGGADPKLSYSPDGYQTPIHFALAQKLGFLAEIFRASGSKDVLAQNGKNSVPLILARQNPEIVKALLEQGAKPDQGYGGLATLTMILYQSGIEAEKRKELLESVALLAQHGSTKQLPEALQVATSMAVDESLADGDLESHQKMYLETIKVLFESLPQEERVTCLNAPLSSTIDAICANPSKGRYIWNCAKFLIQLGADVAAGIRTLKLEDEDPNLPRLPGEPLNTKKAPLWRLARCVCEDPVHESILRGIVDSLLVLSLDQKDKCGESERSRLQFLEGLEHGAIQIAVQQRNKNLVEDLVRRLGDQILWPDPESENAMHWFFKLDHVGKSLTDDEIRLFEYLNTLKPNMIEGKPRSWGNRTPIFAAVRSGDEEGLKLLMKHGADINAQGLSGDTVLHTLAQKKQRTLEEDPTTIAILQCLLEANPNLGLRTTRGATAFHTAFLDRSAGFIREIFTRLPRNPSGLLDIEVLKKARGQQNFLHSAGDRDTTVDFCDLVVDILQSLAENDRQFLLAEEDKSNYTPLHRASDGDIYRADLVSIFLSYRPKGYKTTSSGYTPLSLFLQATEFPMVEGALFYYTAKPQKLSNWGDPEIGVDEKPISDAENLLIKLLECCETPDPDPVLLRWVPWAERMSYRRLLETVAQQEMFRSSSIFNSSILFASLPAPSRLYNHKGGPTRFSDSGYEIYLADYPIPIESERFYFEVGLYPSERIAVGIMPLPHEIGEKKDWYKPVGSVHGIGWQSDGNAHWSNEQHIQALVPILKGPTVEASARTPLLERTIGFGLEYKSKKLFITDEGLPVQVLEGFDTARRWMPAVFITRDSKMTIVFGEQRFKYKGWNKSMEEIEESILTKREPIPIPPTRLVVS
ncbi:hypothetical protein TWF694_008292 [Orbilia ellipsospora]|uniref:Nephrocystin 3-like N-terminal domain-containing protein n=1 Tax=Orbilia ellipsospora TaxID=2528407 RepID=A0AAV9XFN4_9PEZI